MPNEENTQKSENQQNIENKLLDAFKKASDGMEPVGEYNEKAAELNKEYNTYILEAKQEIVKVAEILAKDNISQDDKQQLEEATKKIFPDILEDGKPPQPNTTKHSQQRIRSKSSDFVMEMHNAIPPGNDDIHTQLEKNSKIQVPYKGKHKEQEEQSHNTPTPVDKEQFVSDKKTQMDDKNQKENLGEKESEDKKNKDDPQKSYLDQLQEADEKQKKALSEKESEDKKNKGEPQKSDLDQLQEADEEQRKKESTKAVGKESNSEKKEDEPLTPEQQREALANSIVDLEQYMNSPGLTQSQRANLQDAIETAKQLDKDTIGISEDYEKQQLLAAITPLQSLRKDIETQAQQEVDKDKTKTTLLNKIKNVITTAIDAKIIRGGLNDLSNSNFRAAKAEFSSKVKKERKEQKLYKEELSQEATEKKENKQKLIKDIDKIMSQAQETLELRMQDSTEKPPTRNQEKKKQRVGR